MKTDIPNTSMMEVLKDVRDIAKQGLRELFKERVPRLTNKQLSDLVEIAWNNVPHTVTVQEMTTKAKTNDQD